MLVETLFLLVFTMAALLLIGMGVWQWVAHGRFAQSGIMTTGIVTDITEIRQRGVRTSDVKYTYIVNQDGDQVQYQGTVYDRRGIFKRGARVRLRYLKNKPHVSQVGTQDWRLGATFTLVFGVILLGMCLYAWSQLYA